MKNNTTALLLRKVVFILEFYYRSSARIYFGNYLHILRYIPLELLQLVRMIFSDAFGFFF